MSDQRNEKEPGESGPNPVIKSLMIWGGIFLALLLVVTMFGNSSEPAGTAIGYSDFRDRVAEGTVKSVTIAPDRITGTFKNDEAFSTVPVANDANLTRLLDENNVSYSGAEEEQPNVLFIILLQSLPFLLILGLAFFALRQVQKGGGAGGAMGFGKSKAKLLTEKQGKKNSTPYHQALNHGVGPAFARFFLVTLVTHVKTSSSSPANVGQNR